MARYDTGEFDQQEPPRRNGSKKAVPEEVAEEGPLSVGTIKTLNTERGFGFIKGSSGQEYFFHRSETSGAFDTFQQGDRVSFQPMRSSKGPRAHQIHLED